MEQRGRAALDSLVPLIYAELHRLASRSMRREGPGHTLDTTALVHEAYLRLVNQETVNWQNRAHFFAVSAQAMRHILIDMARGRNRLRRGGGAHHISLEDAPVFSDERAAELIALDDALADLAKLDERKSRIVEMRYFGGLSAKGTARRGQREGSAKGARRSAKGTGARRGRSAKGARRGQREGDSLT